jgi:hypothetical protein
MSLTPSTPDFNTKLKSFWQRPEGKLGAVVLLATAIAAIYGTGLILPWLILLLSNTITAVELAVALFAILYVVTNRTFRSIVDNTFRLGMRWMTSLVIEIDPIGILENTRDKMSENNQKLAEAVGKTRGAKQLVETEISKNKSAIDHATSIKEQADKQLTRETNSIAKQRIMLTRTMELQEIGRKLKSNEKLAAILTQTSKLYDMLVRWQQLAEFNVDNMSAEIENAKAERKTILQAYAGLGFAKKIIKGDPEQMKMLNASLEYLVQDNASKLGDMEDFARYSEKYLTQMDLEQGASADDAEKMLAQYETKLLSAGTPGDAIPVMKSQDAVPVPRSGIKQDDQDYLNGLLK